MVEESSLQNRFQKIGESLVLKKNVDRIVSLGDNKYMTGAYHLNKETGLKSGEMNIVSVDSETG